MKRISVYFTILVFLIVPISCLFSQASGAGSAVVVGLYSETSDGNVSYRVGTGEWIVVKVGMTIPAAAELKINVERDWVQLIPAGNPNSVYELDGSETGDVVKKLAAILKGKPRVVSFPKASDKADSSFKDKLTVKQYLGRQVYRATRTSPQQDIKYGDRLDIKGNVNIIAINNTINLIYPNGKATNIIGPLKFDVEKLFTGQNIYKLLNVAK